MGKEIYNFRHTEHTNVHSAIMFLSRRCYTDSEIAFGTYKISQIQHVCRLMLTSTAARFLGPLRAERRGSGVVVVAL